MKNWADWWRNGFNHAEKTAIKNPELNINSEYQGLRITHDGFNQNDIRQQMVRYAFKLWWMDFVKMIECENGSRDLFARWDGGDAFGLCQMNKKYHKDIPQAYYDGVWQVQIEYCFQKRKWWTKFYWPSRIINGQKCSTFVANRFTFTE